MTIRVVSSDPLTHSRVLFQPASDGASFTLIDQQAVGPIVAQNKLLQNAGPHNRTSEMRRVASLPLNVWQTLQDTWRQQGLSYEDRQKAMRRFLRDPDNQAFRTDNTRFSR